jgi:hypothetical protein
MSSVDLETSISWERPFSPFRHACDRPEPICMPLVVKDNRPGYVSEVRDDDVLLGRGRSHARRPANVRFRGKCLLRAPGVRVAAFQLGATHP